MCILHVNVLHGFIHLTSTFKKFLQLLCRRNRNGNKMSSVMRALINLGLKPIILFRRNVRAILSYKTIPITNESTFRTILDHYTDFTMSAMASQIIGVSIVCSAVCSGTDKRKHQSSASLAFVRGNHRSPVDYPHKEPVARKMFPFDDVIIKSNVMCPEWHSSVMDA